MSAFFNTLAESETRKNEETPSIALVSGKGTDISNNPSLANRARRKLITRKMVLSLIDVAKEKGEHERIQAYWNAYHYLNNVIVSNGRMYGRYCKKNLQSTLPPHRTKPGNSRTTKKRMD
ncbi:MAG: hypothetical protein ABFS16_14655 [Bacteroidota bacterium]